MRSAGKAGWKGLNAKNVKAGQRKEVAEELTNIRLSSGVNQDNFAEELGVNKYTYRLYERAERLPRDIYGFICQCEDACERIIDGRSKPKKKAKARDVWVWEKRGGAWCLRVRRKEA